MDLLRRILGLSASSSATPADDGIRISQSADVQPSGPPEPVIEAPPKTDQAPAQEARPETPPASPAAGTATPQVTALGTHPLPPLETYVPKPGQRLRFGQLSDVGMVRGNNQDALFGMIGSGTSNDDLPDFGLFIVADGMGGHQEGERASAITTRMVAQHVLSEIVMALLDQRMHDPDRPAIAEILRVAVQKANTAVSAQIPEGGTTVTVAAVIGDLAYIAHVGDSRAYLIGKDGIEQITRDHSLVQRLIELDQLTPEEAADHPQRNVLYRALGQSENLDVDAITRRLPPHSRLLLCTDGLWNMVSEDTICEVISRHDNPQAACDELVRLANDRGGPDNISIILVQVPG